MEETDPLTYLVGDEPHCPWNKVIIAMMNTPVSHELDKKWRALALMLNTDRSYKDKLSQQQLLGIAGMSETEQILEAILQEWRSRDDEKATLAKLIEVLEYYKLLPIANRVRKEFNIPEKEEKDKDDKEDDEAESKFPISEESKNIKEHMQYYMADLVDHTSLTDDLMQIFEDNGVLISDQVIKLKSTRNYEDKNLKFYLFVIKAILRNENVYDELIVIFMKDRRNHRDGISCLLNRYFD